MSAHKNKAIHDATYRKKNLEKVKTMRVVWAKANPDKVNKNQTTYRRKNLALYARNEAKRRAKQYQATPSWANGFFIEEIYHLAALRTKMLGTPWEVDHIVPLQSKQVCGLHVEYNLQVIPMKQNRSKGNKHEPLQLPQ
jgi:5-methylcytosine-specific restriction endonuclease McrA